MIEIRVGTSMLSSQELNTLNARQPEQNESQTESLYQNVGKPLYRISEPTVHEHDILGNPQGRSVASSYYEHFDANHSLTDPIDPKPTLNAEHVFVESIVRK